MSASEMKVSPLVRVVSVQVPRAMDWNCPWSPMVVHMIELVESPGAPMSDDTTATWRLGGVGKPSRTCMNSGS